MNVLIPLAEGAEDMETVILADVFRRAGWKVVLAGFSEGPTLCARGVRLVPDADWNDVDPDAFEMIVLPGGSGGAERLRLHAGLREALQRAVQAGKRVGALCAGPTVLHAAGILDGRKATCYPGLEQGLTRTDWQEKNVVRDGILFTSRGPGTCFDFALALIEEVEGPATAKRIADDLLHERKGTR